MIWHHFTLHVMAVSGLAVSYGSCFIRRGYDLAYFLIDEMTKFVRFISWVPKTGGQLGFC